MFFLFLRHHPPPATRQSLGLLVVVSVKARLAVVAALDDAKQSLNKLILLDRPPSRLAFRALANRGLPKHKSFPTNFRSVQFIDSLPSGT
jgi:hypothetical protein